MNRFMTQALYLPVSVAFLAGCGGKGADEVHGTSTRRAEAPATQPAAETARYTAYGEAMKLADADALPVAVVLADPAKYEGKYVRLVGDVNKVCTAKGCWLEMTDRKSPRPLFVKFTCPVDGRLIPMDAVGRPVIVEGTVMVKEISEADARHLKEESGATPEEVAKIKGPQKQITLASPAARVAGL